MSTKSYFMRIKIRNFMCHERLNLTLDQGIEVLTGRTDTGKSAILQAIWWVVTNKPSGDAFIKQGSDKTLVSLIFPEGSVTRIKGKDTNEYRLKPKNQPIRVFKAMRTNVPKEISDFLAFKGINYQPQHDPYFLINKSSGQISREINRYFRLDLLDELRDRLDQRTRDLSSELKIFQDQKNQLKDEIKSLDWVPEADQELQKVEVVDRKRQRVKARLDSNSHLLNELIRIEEVALPDLSFVGKLRNLLSRHQAVNQDIEGKRTLLDEWNQLISTNLPDRDRVENLRSALQLHETKQQHILYLRELYDRVADPSLQEELSNLKLKKQSIQNKINRLGICPICGRRKGDTDGHENCSNE